MKPRHIDARSTQRQLATLSPVYELSKEEFADVDRTVKQVVYKFCGHNDEDLAQEAWVAVARALQRYDPATGIPVAAYVRHRAKGALYDHVRTRRKKQRGVLEVELVYLDIPQEEEDDVVDRSPLLNKILARHSRRDREILRAYASGMTQQEIGDWYGLTNARISQIIKDARRKV